MGRRRPVVGTWPLASGARGDSEERMPAHDHRDKTYRTADAIRGRIQAGIYPPRTFLPAERKFAEDLGVARTTLRAALTVLEEQGLINRQAGRGSLVRGPGVKGVSGVIPLFIRQRDPAGPLTPEAMALVGGALCACGGSDLRFLIHAAPVAKPAEVLEVVRKNHAPGVLFVECDSPEALAALRDKGVPYAVINQELDIPGPCTRVDFWGVGRRAAGELLRLGHRRLGLLAGPRDRHMYERMLAGFRGRAAESEVAIQPKDIATVSTGSEAARAASLKLLKRADRPTALFCMRDARAYGAFLAARELGLGVPKDLSLIGYDDITWPGQGREFLTTFPEPTQELSLRAIDLLMEWIRTGNPPDDVAVLPDIAVRRSTARCPRSSRKR